VAAAVLGAFECGRPGSREGRRTVDGATIAERESVRIRGQRLRDARIAKGMTVGDLAERSRIDAETIASLESGRDEAPLGTVRKLADVLGVAVEDLVMWGDEA
jgi:DNA-binding XRE family transcriptional regulator